MHFNYYDSDVTQTLQSHGATQKDMDVLRDYIGNPFNLQALPASLCLPLKDEPFAAAWRQYENETVQHGIEEVLRNRFTQFNFPVKTGISNTPQYQQALKKGLLPEHAQPKGGVNFSDPANITLFVHESPAGSIGVILAGKRQDFVTLVQTLLYKNEPAQIPDSLGAFMVSGYNNWDRIRNYKQQWMANQNTIGDDFSWMLEFEQLKKKKELYQDRFIILSSGPYSDIPAADMGMEPGAWREKSVSLRLEHECTHYFTRRVFSSMRKNIWDEILADYMGITAAHGSFSARWFLLFMGLENYPEYRPGGRLEKYVPDSLSISGFEVLMSMTFTAARHLQELDIEFGPEHRTPKDRSILLLALCVTGLPALCRSDYRNSFLQAYNSACSCLKMGLPLKYFRNKNDFHSSNKHTGRNQASPANLQDNDFTAIYRIMAPKIFNYLIRLCGNKDLAEDILQETFLAVHQKIDAFEGRSSLSTWIFTIATNKFLDSQRNAWSRASTNSTNMEVKCSRANPEQQTIINQDIKRLHHAIQQLPLKQKAALFLVRFEGMKYREAAEVLGVPLSTVRMRIYKALVALKDHLKKK